MAIQNIGVIGAGQMGTGIAHVCALAGYDVRLVDVDKERVDQGLSVIDGNMDRQVGRGRLKPDEKVMALSRIHPATDYSVFKECDLVIEAATENEAIKRENTPRENLQRVANKRFNFSNAIIARHKGRVDIKARRLNFSR